MSVPKKLKLTEKKIKGQFREFVDNYLWAGDDPDESKRPYNAMVDHSTGKPNKNTSPNIIASYNFIRKVPVRLDNGKVINLVGALTFAFVDEDSELRLDDGYKPPTIDESIEVLNASS